MVKEKGYSTFKSESDLIQSCDMVDIVTPTLYHHQNALNAIKRNDAKKKHDKETQPEQPKLFLDKEFIYETRDDVYIYRDARTKKKGYYIRIYDPKTQKHWTKSLRTTNRMVAMTQAEKIYAERKGRLSFGVRPESITARDLSALLLFGRLTANF